MKLNTTDLIIFVSYCNAQAALPTGLKQPLIIKGKTQTGSHSAPTPGAIYIEIQGGVLKARNTPNKGNNRYIKVSG